MASAQIKLPEGFELDKPTVPDGFVVDEPAPERLSPRQRSIQGRPGLGIGEAALSLGSGMVAGPVSGLAGIAGAVLPGPEGQGAAWAGKTQEALTYQPKTETGQDVTDVATYPFRKLSELGNWAGEGVTDKTGSPMLGTAANVALNMLPSLISKGAKPFARQVLQETKAKLANEAAQNAPKDSAWREAAKEGYVVPPTKIEKTAVRKGLESLGGKAAISQEAAQRNQIVTNKIARREAGIGENDPITPSTLEAARDVMAAPYKEVSKLSPTAASAWQEARQARANAKAHWKHYNRSSDPAVMEKARQFDAEAKFYEDLVDQEATNLNRPDLLAALRDARQKLAKNYDVERALNVSTGEVDAKVLGRMYEKDKGKRMTGGLATIGKFANQFGLEARRGSTVPSPGVSALNIDEAVALGAIGGWHAAGLPLLRGPARGRALSKTMQKGREYQPGMAVRLSEMATRNPYAFAVAPSLGLRREEE